MKRPQSSTRTFLMNITPLMLAFLFNLQSQGMMNLPIADDAQYSEHKKRKLIDEFIYQNEWEFYICMDQAIDAFISIEKQRKINYNKQQKIAI